MDRSVYLASHPDEPEALEALIPALTSAGFTPHSYATTKVGDSPLDVAMRFLHRGIPVIICGTYRGVATRWVGQLANAANSLPKNRVFVVQMHEDLDVERLSLSRIVADYWRDPDGAMQQLCDALQEFFPPETSFAEAGPRSTPERPHDYLDELTSVTQFDSQAVDEFRTQLRPSAALRLPAELSDWDFLQRSSVMRDGRLTKAGVLLFGRDPGDLIPTATVQCTQYFGIAKTARRDTVEIAGSVPRQIANAYQFVADRVREGDLPTGESVNAAPAYRYPMIAIREVIANALVHRDYQASDMCVHLRLYSDRIEVTSPGQWEGRRIVSDEEHDIAVLVGESRRRNFRLASVLTWSPLFEGEGSGLPTAIEECERLGAPHPHMTQQDGFVKLIIRPRPDDGPLADMLRPSRASANDVGQTLTADRIAEVVVTEPERRRRGSGYRVTNDTVLTAANVVGDAREVFLRFSGAGRGEWTAPATVEWLHPDSDMAVLRFIPPVAAPAVSPVRYAQLADRNAVLDVTSGGFPRWKTRHRSDGTFYRDMVQVVGTTALLSNVRSGSLELVVPAPGEDSNHPDSPWSGMSGAAVWADDRIIGVITEHHRSDGLGRLSAARLDRWLESVGSKELAAALGIPTDVGLIDVVPAGRTSSAHSGYLQQVRDIAPTSLLEREDELAELASFCADKEPYLWLQGEPWSGKSALASTFVLNPPSGVDVVSFFVTARLAGQSDSTAFTDALLDQLSAIVDEPIPANLSESSRDAHRRRLLSAAARQTRQTGRRLVVVVDGLDEDRGGAAGSGTASIASILPRRPEEGLKVLVTSRPHQSIPSDVPPDHPIRLCRVRLLTASTHASQIILSARAELNMLLAGDALTRDLIGLIACADGGITADQLGTLTGRPQYEIARVLDGVASRTINRREGEANITFSHESLLAIAKDSLGAALVEHYRTLLEAHIDRDEG